MASKYFIQKDGQTLGPMSASDVKTLAQSGRLMPNDLVWQEGSEKKVRAEEVKGLTFKSPQVVPPSPAQDDVPSPVKDNVPSVRSEPSNSNDQRAFHYEINGENQGTISFLELQGLVRQKVVTKETQVWHDGLEDWTPASEIKELAASFPADAKKAPPPLKKSPQPVIAGPSQTQLLMDRLVVAGVVVAVLICICVIGSNTWSSSSESGGAISEVESGGASSGGSGETTNTQHTDVSGHDTGNKIAKINVKIELLESKIEGLESSQKDIDDEQQSIDRLNFVDHPDSLSASLRLGRQSTELAMKIINLKHEIKYLREEKIRLLEQ
jgi:hypothetical protein